MLTPRPAWSRQSFTDRYDEQIQSAVKRYWPDRPFWKEWKAQLYQESRLDPSVCSSVGACGLAQFMPKSWADISRQIGEGDASPHDAKAAIPAGAYYMAKLRQQWKSERPAQDRQELAQASYNAGAGSLIKAQQRCGNPALYAEIVACLPEVTGQEFSKQTTTYVQRIAEWWRQMELAR